MVGAIYMLRAIRSTLHGPLPEQWSQVRDASNSWRRLPFVLLLAGLITFGFFPGLLVNKIRPTVDELVARYAISAGTSVVAPHPMVSQSTLRAP